MVYVQLMHGGKAKMSFTEPIVVTGTLKISNVKALTATFPTISTRETVKPYVEQ